MKLPVKYADIQQKKPLIIKLSENKEYVSLFLRRDEYRDYETRMRTYMEAFQKTLEEKAEIEKAMLTADGKVQKNLMIAMRAVDANYVLIYKGMIDLICRASIFYPTKMKYIEERLRSKHEEDLIYVLSNYNIKKTNFRKVRRDLRTILNKDVDLCFDIFEKLVDYNKPYVKKKLERLQTGITSSRPIQKPPYSIVSKNVGGRNVNIMKPITPKSSSI